METVVDDWSQMTGATGDAMESAFAQAPPPPPQENGSSEDPFTEASAAPVSEEVAPVEPAAPVEEAPLVDTTDAFFTDYQPASSLAEPIMVPEPVAADPRVEWNDKNSVVLAKKSDEEAGAKRKMQDKAKEHIGKFYEARGATLKARHDKNRAEEVVAQELPDGASPWEKVHSMINFNAGVHHKDVTRYKTTLVACKTRNVAVRG